MPENKEGNAPEIQENIQTEINEIQEKIQSYEELQKQIEDLETDVNTLTSILQQYLDYKIETDIKEEQAKIQEVEAKIQQEEEQKEQEKLNEELQENYETQVFEKLDLINQQLTETNTVLAEQTDFISGDFNNTIVTGLWLVIITIVATKGVSKLWDNMTKW